MAQVLELVHNCDTTSLVLNPRCFVTMLDLITLISTMGVQQELSETQDKRITIHDQGEDENLVSQAADSLSSAFESFEEALSQGMESVFGSSEPEPAVTKTV